MHRYRIPSLPAAGHTRPALAHTLLLACALVLLLPAANAPAGHAVPPAELAAGLADGDAPAVLDVRTVPEYRSGHIPGAINVPVGELGRRLDELAAYRDRPVIVHCEAGPRADYAASMLRAAGFSDLHELSGHMRAWRQGGYPMEKPAQ